MIKMKVNIEKKDLCRKSAFTELLWDQSEGFKPDE